MSETLMEVKHLKKYFETPKGMLHAVDDVSFSIGRGKTMGVVGESGCGKSTLGRTLIHLYESTGGQILFDGEDITRVNKRKMHELREKMQIIFQDPFASLNSSGANCRTRRTGLWRWWVSMNGSAMRIPMSWTGEEDNVWESGGRLR